MKNTSTKDYRTAWTTKVSKQIWETFSSRICNGARKEAFDIFETFLGCFTEKPLPITFVEVGFGQTADFTNFARALHDGQKIVYTGFDITEQFVAFARETHPSYSFNHGGFLELPKKQFDLSYTRHVLEHLDPAIYEKALRALLRATRYLCVISWFSEPGIEKISWEPSCGFDCNGAYCNTYSKKLTNTIIEQEGFVLSSRPSDGGVLYILQRNA